MAGVSDCQYKGGTFVCLDVRGVGGVLEGVTWACRLSGHRSLTVMHLHSE